MEQNDNHDIFEAKKAKGMLKNFSVILAAFAMVVLIALVFADVSFEATFSLQWAVKLGFYLILMYVLFFSMQSTGIQDGRVQDGYVSARSKYNTIRETIRSDSELESLQDFCDEYIVNELRAARTKVLRAASIPYSMFAEKWLENDDPLPTDISRKKRLAIRLAQRLKPITLTPDMLLSCGSLKIGRAPLGATPAAMLARRTLVKMLPRTAMTFLVVDLGVNVITNPSWETLITGLMMCFVGCMCAYEGYESGFRNVVDDACRYIDRQTNILSQYVIWVRKKGGPFLEQTPCTDRAPNEIADRGLKS